MPHNLLANPDFESSSPGSSDISPWACNGNVPSVCGVFSDSDGLTPQQGRNFGYIIGESRLGQQVKAKGGLSYNLTYYAYSFNTVNAEALVGWAVQLGSADDITSENQTDVFPDTPLASWKWPFFTHTFTAESDNVGIGFVSQPNTKLFIDNVALYCLGDSTGKGCPAPPTSTGAIAGGVVGGIAALAVLSLGFFAFQRRRTRLRRKKVGESVATITPGSIKSMGWSWSDKGYHPGGVSGISSTNSPPPQSHTSHSNHPGGAPPSYPGGSPPPLTAPAPPPDDLPEEERGVGDITQPDVYPEFPPHRQGTTG